MFKWLSSLIFPHPTKERQQILDKIKEYEEHGVRVVFAESVLGWRLEFDNDEAYRWYFNKVAKGFKYGGGE